MAIGLVGDWIVAGVARYSLAADGTCNVSLDAGQPGYPGIWRPVSEDSFEIVLRSPGVPGAPHEPALDEDRVTHYRILNNQPDRLIVEGREGGAQGLVHDPVEWVLAQAMF